MTVTEKRSRKARVLDGLDQIDALLERIDQAADRLLAPSQQEDPGGTPDRGH